MIGSDTLRRARAIGALGLAFALAIPASLHAQNETPFSLSVHPESGSLEMHIGDLFRDPGLVNALHSGLPVRLEVKAELWKDGFFDSQRGSGAWRASILFDPMEQRYRVATGVGGYTELTVDSLPEVTQALQVAFALPLRPSERGRYYYLGQIQMETLSLTDLGELQRWLRGDVAPELRGERAPGTAVGRGMHRVLVRVLGIPARRYRLRTPKFEFEARDPS